MSSPPIERVAREVFGFERLRPGQREAIEAVLAGHDTLAAMPAGSGKSAIYEIAGQIRPASTVVVSPLSEGPSAGAPAHLFLTPERLADDEVLRQVRDAGPSLIVIDQAHCICEGRRDFRPDYLRLGAFIAEMGHPPVLALTVTPSPLVREQIVEKLHLHDPLVIVRGFDRPNIWLGVERFDDESPKRRALVQATDAAQKPGLVYAATRRAAEEIAAELAGEAAAYHPGVPGRRRDAIQNGFMAGELGVIVATTAFGIAIDKPDIRFVHHHDPSGSFDSYYHEIGHAGRDGEPARALLFHGPEGPGSPAGVMGAYAEHPGCRRQFILSCFGEDYGGPCGNCDSCAAGGADASAEAPV